MKAKLTSFIHVTHAARICIAALTCALGCNVASAAAQCLGKVTSVYKWNNMSAVSAMITLDGGGTTNWVLMPTKSDEALAMMALATGKPVNLYWVSADITTCVSGWAHNRSLEGYFAVSN